MVGFYSALVCAFCNLRQLANKANRRVGGDYLVTMTTTLSTLAGTVRYDQLSNQAQVSVLMKKKLIRFESVKHSP